MYWYMPLVMSSLFLRGVMSGEKLRPRDTMVKKMAMMPVSSARMPAGCVRGVSVRAHMQEREDLGANGARAYNRCWVWCACARPDTQLPANVWLMHGQHIAYGVLNGSMTTNVYEA